MCTCIVYKSIFRYAVQFQRVSQSVSTHQTGAAYTAHHKLIVSEAVGV